MLSSVSRPKMCLHYNYLIGGTFQAEEFVALIACQTTNPSKSKYIGEYYPIEPSLSPIFPLPSFLFITLSFPPLFLCVKLNLQTYMVPKQERRITLPP